MKQQHSGILLGLLALLLVGCQKDIFTTEGMAEDHFFLKSGNQHMPVTVAGNVDAKKFLVVIHGGPGGTAIAYRDAYVKEHVETELALVYWDQRFAGNTQGNNGSTDIEVFRADITQLLTLLRAKYGAEHQYYLFAHSWGGFLAPYFLVEDDNQALVDGWIQIGGAHNYRMNDSLTREMLLVYGRQALAAGENTANWEEIVTWCEENGFEGTENAGTLNGYAHQAEGLIADINTPPFDFDLAQLTQLALMSQLSNGFISGLRAIDGPTYVTPNSDRLQRILLPTLLLWGKYDFVCPPELALDIEMNIGSTTVNKVIYQHSGHSPMVNEPALFWSDVVNWVKAH